MIKGNEILAAALAELNINLPSLIARVAIWASPEAYHTLKAENGHGVFYPNTRRYRAGRGETKNAIVDGVRLDDNSYANEASKRAMGFNRDIDDVTVCHIWPDSCYDHRYHTCIANLVLIPSAVAGLSDHDADTIACLKYRSFELYQWHPIEEEAPSKPILYPSVWRPPMTFSPKIKGFINNRRQQIPD